MDHEIVAILVIVFGTPVTIVAISCTYKIVKKYLELRFPSPNVPSHPLKTKDTLSVDSSTLHELTAIAGNLQKRLQTLEEIIQSDPKPGGDS